MAEIALIAQKGGPTRVAEPVVSVVMVMHNAAATVWQSIRSLQLQTLSDWELILIDDGSTDDSMQIAGSFADPRIRMGTDGKRRGLAMRLNQAIAFARAPLIARMDADDVCFPERLKKQVAFLSTYPEIDLVGCGAVVFAESGASVGLLPVPQRHKEIAAAPWRGFPLPHPTWCGRTEWFRRNLYNPKLARAQDQDLLLRSHARSKFAAIPEVLLGYRQQQLVLGKMLRGRVVYVRSLWLYGRNELPLSVVIGGIFNHLAKILADIVLLGLGLNRIAQRQRLETISDPVSSRWTAVWKMLEESALQSETPVLPTSRSTVS